MTTGRVLPARVPFLLLLPRHCEVLRFARNDESEGIGTSQYWRYREMN
jgi:hypothetical protein